MANTPIGSLTATWNNGGTTYNAIKMNVTNSASAAGSRLLTLQIGGTDKFYVDKNGAVFASGAITLAANDAGALGASGTAFSDLFLAIGGVINWNAGDVTVTHAVNTLTFAGASLGYIFDAVIKPSANDGFALGVSGTAFSDLFLASGAVIDFLAGDVTITHSADKLAFASAASGYTFDTNIVVGHTTGLSIGAGTSKAEVFGTDGVTGGLVLGVFSATVTHSGHLDFYKSANAAVGSATVVASGERIGAINAYGAQQTGTLATQNIAAQIRFEIDAAVTSGAGADMPGRIVLGTTPDGSGTITDRLILDSAGILKPNANDGVALGTTALSFSDLFLASGAVLNFNAGNYTVTHSAGLLTTNGALTVGGALIATTGTHSGAVLPSANDAAALGASGTGWADLFLASGGVLNWNAGNYTITHTAGLLTTNGALTLGGALIGTSGTFSGVVQPSANDAAALGASGTAWADLFLASGAVLNFNAGNYTVTHSAGLLTTNGALTIVGALKQSANDGGALGASGTAWADLFLASGAVIDFLAGNVVITHSSGILTMGTGELRITTPGTGQTSVPSMDTIGVFQAEQASTSGTSIDFLSIPAWAKRIEVMLVGVSTNGTSDIVLQIGKSGGVETSGYLGAAAILSTGGAAATSNFTASFGIGFNMTAASVFHGRATLTLEDASDNTWVCTSMMGRSDVASVGWAAGSKPLAGTLDRVRITTAGGANTFDAGVIRIRYYG